MLNDNFLVGTFAMEMYGPYEYLLWFIYLNCRFLFTRELLLKPYY